MLTPDISIITLSRNINYFRQLNEELAKVRLSYPLVEHILVNNCSSLRTSTELSSEAVRSNWIVVAPGYNASYAVGNNIAAKVASAPYLLLLNDDVLPEEGFLTGFWQHRNAADVVGCLLLHDDGSVNHAGTSVSSTRTDHIGRRDSAAKWQEQRGAAVALTPSVTFAAALVQAAVYRELGGLDERYSYGFEDTDFCLRVLQAGGRVACARDVVGVHDECGTRPRGSQADQANAQLFFDRWHQAIPAIITGYLARERGGVEGCFK